MLEVLTIPVTVFGQNARVLWCSETKKGVVVDPGGDAELLAQACSSNGIEVQEIWLTHSHLDHCAGVASLLVKYSVPLVAHPNEKMLREKIPDIAQMYGLPREDWPRCPEPDRVISGGEELWVGQVKAKVLFTPGHSPGHVSFYFPADRVLVSGDVLFQGSIGRTDLPGHPSRSLRNWSDSLDHL